MSEANDYGDRLLDHMQAVMWAHLNNDLRHAINGYWSMAAESTVNSIVLLARHRGVLPAGSIQVALLKSGVYAAVCELIGTKCVIDFDLSRYEQYWGPWELMALSVAEIRKMEVEELDLDES